MSSRSLNSNKPYMHVQDQKASATNAGTSAVGTEIRELNTVLTNEIAGASLASNQITLPAGTYRVRAHSPAYQAKRHKAYLYNVTDAAIEISGAGEYSSATDAVHTRSFVDGQFTITAEKAFEIRQYFAGALAGSGLGLATAQASTGVEVYASIEIWKVA